jgi:hypothetical protein
VAEIPAISMAVVLITNVSVILDESFVLQYISKTVEQVLIFQYVLIEFSYWNTFYLKFCTILS